MTKDTRSQRVLVLTVGTGNADEIEKTLIVPMQKSIDKGEWTRVVLLPSTLTEDAARTLQERNANSTVEIKPLLKSGQEYNVDSSFEHFDSVLAGLIDNGYKPSDIQVDFTRGTKPMSAALVLAAVGRGISTLRYIYGEQRDGRGMAVPGTEKVGEVLAIRTTARRRLDQAKEFVRQGDFSAAINLLPDPQGRMFDAFPEAFRSEVRALRAAAHIYAAWDRLDYKAAVQAWEQYGAVAAGAGALRPTSEMEKWIRRLTPRPEQNNNYKARATYLRYLACDLWANAERRIRDAHYEDALIRAYRVLELVGQIRLFDQGYDSASLPLNNEEISALSPEFREEKRTGRATAGRDMVTRLLQHLKDPFAGQLRNFSHRHNVARIRNRNNSVLNHGFTAAAPSEAGPLRKVITDLKELLIKDDAKAKERLTVARSLDFSQS